MHIKLGSGSFAFVERINSLIKFACCSSELTQI